MDVVLFSSPTWFYIDRLGYERGPFRPDEMWGWYNAGYFPADLMVRSTVQSTFTRIASLAVGNAVQPMVTLAQLRYSNKDGNPFEKIKEEGTIGISVNEDRVIIKEEVLGSLLEHKQEFKEDRWGKIEVKKEYIEIEIKDEYIKPEVRDEFIKPENRDEYVNSAVKVEYIKPEVKDEYIKPEVASEYIKPEVKKEYLKTEIKDEYLKPEVKGEYINSEVKSEYIESEIKEESLKPAIKDIEPDINIVSHGNESNNSILYKLNVNSKVKELRIRYMMNENSPYIEIKNGDSFEEKELSINKQIIMLENSQGLMLKKGDVFKITGKSKSGRSWRLNNGEKFVPVDARGSMYDIFIPTDNKETRIRFRTKLSSKKEHREINEKYRRKLEIKKMEQKMRKRKGKSRERRRYWACPGRKRLLLKNSKIRKVIIEAARKFYAQNQNLFQHRIRKTLVTQLHSTFGNFGIHPARVHQIVKGLTK